jgi:hypothetical protein
MSRVEVFWVKETPSELITSTPGTKEEEEENEVS